MAIKITQIKPEGAQKSAPSAKDYSGEKKGSTGSAVSGSSGRIQITKIPGTEKQRSIAASRKTTRETEHADELDKQTTPSASRQASKQTFGQRVLKGIESGLVSEGANLANLGGVAADRRGGTEMSQVYRRQAETLDKQIAALEKTLKDPTMTAQDIKETNEALAIARSEREKYGKVIESGEKTASGLYDTADKGYSFAQKLSEESTAGTKGIKKGVLSIVPAATQIGLQTAERMVAPGMDVAGRALSAAGGNAADYRRKAGEQYDAEKATLRATVSALGVAAGGALSKGVNAAGLKLLRAAGKQNYVLPNIALGGASAVGYAAGETGASELSKAMTDEEYTPDWGAIGETALTAFAFGAISSAINAAAITGRNKKYMNELNDAAKERYDYAKRIIEDPRATAEQKAAGAQSVMDAVDKMRYTLDDLQVVGAQKEVDAMREFLLSIYGEMLPYTGTSAGGIGTGASRLVPVAPVGGGIAPVQTGDGMSAVQENAPTVPISPRAPGAAAVMQNSTPAAMPTVGQQNTMPARPAPTPESAQGTGGGHLTPAQPNAAQGAAEGKADVLDAGKRVNLLEYSNEQNAQKVKDGLNDGTLAVDAKENIYRVDEGQHIDRRDSASVGERSVNAFQFDHPELHSYYADAAAVLQEEMSFAQKGGELIRRTSREAGDDEYIRTKRGVSERIARLLDDEGVRYDDIDRSLDAIIHNHGQENFAAAKRVELLLDDMLTNGYTDIHGQRIAPNEAYIAAKKAIPGADMSERTHEELPIYDMPEGRNGGIYGRQEENAGGLEPAEGAGQRADAVAAENDLYGGDGGRRPSEPGAGGAGELRSTTAEGRRRNRELTQQRREIAWQQPLTSAAALGVQGGTSDETLHVLPEESWDDELRGFSDWARGKGVKRVTMVTGLLQVETENGPVGVRGIINRESGEMVLRVDGEKRTASEIGKHEVGHLITEEENVRAFMEAVRGGADWRGIYDVYERCYEPLTNGYVGMTAEERELYVWEEIMEDAYAGIDSYGQRASRYHEQAVSAIERAAAAAEHPASEPEGLTLRAVDEVKSRGPPEKFSIQRTQDIPYQEQIDAFYEGDSKTVGRSDDIYVAGPDNSSDALGLGGKPFFVLKRNLQKITRKEGANKNYSAHGIGEDIIRDLPDMLKDPAMVIVGNDRISVIPGRTVDTVREKAAPLLIGINPNGSVDGKSAYEIKTMYGREGFSDWLGLRAKDSKIIAGNENKATALLRNVGIKITEPVAYAADLTNAILSQSEGNVKSPTLGDEIRRQITGEEAPTTASNNKALGDKHEASSDTTVSDDGGNVKPKVRFSLDEPVEETKTLVAMHNMTEEKLRRTLDIGAWPAPSIAIVKAKDGHTNYGEYSAVFPRETIDPQRSSKNKVYGGDAWTPTRSNARVEYEVDQGKARALEREIDRLSSEFAGGAFQNSSVIGAAGVGEETELSLDDIAERLAKYPAVQAAYLQSKGESLEPVYKEKKFDSLGNDVLRQYIDRVGMQEVARLYVEMETGGSLDESALNAARDVIVDDWAKRNARLLERRAENRDKLIAVQKNRLEDWRIEKFIRNAEAYIEQNGTSGDEVDKEATSAKMYSMIAPGGSWGDAEKTVQQWVRPRLDGMLGKPGIYNGKDPYTDNGRKPFKETHWDYTAENIVRAMSSASDRGEGMWGLTGGTLTATSAPQYDSVDAIHADEERLRAESDDVHEKRLRDLDIEIDRVVDDLLRSTKAHSDSEYEERHILEDVLAEAAKGEHSPAAIKRSFAKDGYTIKDGNAKAIMRLFDIAAKIPVGYFEAKPQRVVGFDEALAVVAPDDAPSNLLSEMRDAGMNVVEYRAGDDADRLDKINSIKNVRFSMEDEDGGEWDKELARMPRSVQEAVQRVKDERGKKPNMQEFPNLDAYLSGRSAQQAAEKAERLRDKGKDEFKGTEALKKLGVKIENSAGDYSNVEQLIANDQAAKTIQRETRKAIKRLGATPKEQNFALNIASGLYDEADIPATMNRGKVVELADYYSAEQSMSTDFIRQRRAEINENLQEKMKDLFDEHFDGEFTKEKSGKGIAPESGFALYHRTPQRSMRAIFGWKRGEKINEAIFEPVYVNEQERKRFVNRMHDEVRTFKGKDGKEEALTRRERALAQLSIEGKAVEEMVGKSEIKQQIIHAAENLLDGAEMKDAAQEFGLHGKEERELAQRYADWLETKKELDGGEVDRVKVENAAAKYSGIYNEFYAAINDFLVAHGYEPIGFIKGYAPHFQPEAESGKLERALKAIGVDLGAEVGKLPASIAGLTKEFKPNKRYNPFFQHRNGKSTDYDIQKGFEKYVDYLSDVLYHTDDIMRTRAASKYFRKKYAPDEISAQIQQAEDLKFATAEEKELFLKTNGIIDSSAKMSYQAMNQAMEKYTDSLFDDVTQTTKYGDLVTWLDDYANKLAGKQLFNDRSMEREVGRMSLNVGRKLVSTFARANVAGNLSSALNQTAQLPMIAGELGPKYVAEAIGDIIKGEAKGDFADRSDFLTEKHGINYLTSTKGDKFTAALFWPLERMDYLVSSIAVRGKYRKELAEGKSEKDALRAADRWGRDMMGSRSKGTAPLTFQSKNLISQMVNLFQVEALNSWEHVTQDLFGPGLREMEEKLGKKEASRRLAGIIVGTLLGAFILNRVDEELYGGTPAQFDVLGLLVGFLASGNGLSTNEQLGVWVDDVWQKMTGERLFGTDEDTGNDEFNLAAATEDTLYNVSNDVPYVRNVSGLLGLGDQTLPMPDIYGTAKGIGSAVSDAVSGDTEGFGSEIMRQLMGLAGDTVPGGRQVEKSVQGAGVIKNGGLYKGSGENKRLQYPAKPFLEDPWEALRAGLFGRNALSEARDFYAANDGGLSASQTRTYQELVDMGADREAVYDAIQKWRKIDKDDSLTDGEREAAQFELVRKLKLTNEQKERLHDDLSRSSRSYAAAQEAQKQGISAEAYAKYKDATADLTADKDENGKTINGSKKAKVLDAIDKMQLSKKQKDWLYLDAGYSEKDIGKAPWNS